MKRFLLFLLCLWAVSATAVTVPTGTNFIVVSAKGKANGLSATVNDGCLFGPDTAGTISSGIMEAWGTGNQTVFLAPGVYSVTTNALVMPPNTTLKGMGKAIILQVNGNDRGPILELNTNCVVDGITITNTISARSTGSIGIGTNSPGCSNAIVQNCIFYGNSNAVYFGCASNASQTTFINCLINGNVMIRPGDIPTAVSSANARSNEVALVNCIINGSIMMNFGFSNQLTMIGGQILQRGAFYGLEVAWNKTYIHGTKISGNLNNADIHVHSAFLYLYDYPGDRARIWSSAFSAVAFSGMPVPWIDETSQNSLAAADAFMFGAPGTTIFSTSGSAYKTLVGPLKDYGLEWLQSSTSIDTNKIEVAGSPDANYNGIYTYKQNTVGAMFGLEYTNLLGRFLMWCPDIYTNQGVSSLDGAVGLSANASLSDGLEYDIADCMWCLFQSNPGISVHFLQTNTYQGFFFISRGPNGEQLIRGYNTEETTLNTAGLTTDTTANLLPANSLIKFVPSRVTTTITTAVSFSVGDSAQAARFSASAGGMTAGSTRTGMDQWNPAVATANLGPQQVAAAKVRYTFNANPGAGKVRTTVFYEQIIPATQ